MSSFTFPPQNPDGLWKGNYVVTYSDGDSTVNLAKILLKFDGNSFTLANFDNLFTDNKAFINHGIVDSDNNVLIFNKDSINEKHIEYTFSKDGHLAILTGKNRETKMIFGKIEKHNLGNMKDEMKKSFLENNFLFTFSYFDDPVEIEFHPDHSFMVVNSVKPYFPVFSKWDVLTFDNELFVYFSGMAPFVQITGYENGVYDCFDESDKVYSGNFKKAENKIKFDKKLIPGIWEQKNAQDIDFRKIPQALLSREFYPKQVWIFNDSIAKVFEDFRTSESPFEISKNGEMISFIAFNRDSYRHFRIIKLDKEQMIVERYFGELGVKQDTLLRQKKMPKPTTPEKYFKKK